MRTDSSKQLTVVSGGGFLSLKEGSTVRTGGEKDGHIKTKTQG